MVGSYLGEVEDLRADQDPEEQLEHDHRDRQAGGEQHRDQPGQRRHPDDHEDRGLVDGGGDRERRHERSL